MSVYFPSFFACKFRMVHPPFLLLVLRILLLGLVQTDERVQAKEIINPSISITLQQCAFHPALAPTPTPSYDQSSNK